MTEIYKLDVEVDGNPVGNVHVLEEVQNKIAELYEKWKEEYPELPWYKKWIGWVKPNVHKVTMFLMESLDELIHMVDDMIEVGPDKKATVLAYIDQLYEVVGRDAVPMLLKPFAGKIKHYVVYTLISASIDWIVGKYRGGEWLKKVDEKLHGEGHVKKQSKGKVKKIKSKGKAKKSKGKVKKKKEK